MIDIPKNNLPPELSGKLEFGNRIQINALRAYEAELDQQNSFSELQAEGKLKYYEVSYKVSGHWSIKVWAKNTDHAKQIAENMFNDGEDIDDLEVDYADVDEIHPGTRCICHRFKGDDKNKKPYGWDRCPIHGNTSFEKSPR